MNEPVIWLGMVFCLTQSAIFSGMNLAVFSLSRLRLEAAAEADHDARRVLGLRRNANFTLSSILWGNVAINVLLALLANSVLTGIAAFLFSTVVITIVGEIMPQAYFSRHALRIAARLAPLLRLYQVFLWPVAWPSGKLLDIWIGPEGIPWYRERELRHVLQQHAHGDSSEIGKIEATGAINFLHLDDIPVGQEGEPLDPRSIFQLPFRNGKPIFPTWLRSPEDGFLRDLNRSGRKWIVIVDEQDEPRFVLNAHAFIRRALFGSEPFDPVQLCHRPLVIRDTRHPLGQVLDRLIVRQIGRAHV